MRCLRSRCHLAAGDDDDDEDDDDDGDDGNDSVGAAASAAGSEERRISASATEAAEADGGTPPESGTIERDECCCGVKGRVQPPARPLLWRRCPFASGNRDDDEEEEGRFSPGEGDSENATQEKKDARRPITSSITERRRLL
jgi:hypothetical protein